jgi:hypothetical protein
MSFKQDTIQNLICKRQHEGSTQYLVQFNERNDAQWINEKELQKHGGFYAAVEELRGNSATNSCRSRSGSDVPLPESQ